MPGDVQREVRKMKHRPNESAAARDRGTQSNPANSLNLRGQIPTILSHSDCRNPRFERCTCCRSRTTGRWRISINNWPACFKCLQHWVACAYFRERWMKEFRVKG